MGQSSPTPASQMMYPYSHHSGHGQQQPQTPHHMAKPAPLQPTWAVPQTHSPYYPMPRAPPVGRREDPGQLLGTSQSPAMNTITYNNGMTGAEIHSTTDYFPGIIDTSEYCERKIALASGLTYKVLGAKRSAKSWNRFLLWTRM
jgi:hypothetical protein